ncbi:hypothetical protein SAMN05216207_100377 [Pseudonocardia ammonioxydans]|uniref:Uncharacterized protein n=1 Tax=Pseudonocardia ammonioxydans TaxID=260086 RepID=A0A1I4TYQ6_PSUAM|nr:hypothetical protein [Pseudonocardia ammonioxydans]SFM81710.1 hypothetical protein SAMN05216207_100377 [Pseudonocardia ammonioxydans]
MEDATAALLIGGIGDGLPVVPPTAARLEAMLAGVAAPDAALGAVPPLFSELTPAGAAYHAVLAGCRPSELGVVQTALQACLAPEFNLLGVQTTTGTAAVAVVVRGPVVAALGMNTGTNLLGPGNRANAAIGRAVALALAGIGGARPGETDMATTGQPGRYGLCLPVAPRAADDRPEDADTVTVLAVGGTAEVLPRGEGRTAAEILDPPAALLAGSALAAGDPGRMSACEQALVVPPEVAERVHALGIADVAAELYRRGNELLANHGLSQERVAASAEAVHVLVTGGAGIKMVHLPGWIGGSRAVTRPIRCPGGEPVSVAEG